MDLEKIRSFIRKNPAIAYPVLALSALILWTLLMALTKKETKVGKVAAMAVGNAAVGLSVGGVDQQAYVARLEKNYYDFEARVKSMEDQVKNIKKLTQDLKKQQKETSKAISDIDLKSIDGSQGNVMGMQQPLELSIADIGPVKEGDGDFVYLPIGSFCKGTLLTGVYAAADVNSPLPVLIELEEAFYGPNKTRIPLKGSFVLGKAYGDLVSERAFIQIVALSSVLPDGSAFEREENLGYITDQYGELGVRGKVVRNTGKELAASFLGGFTAGGAQAIADAETTTTRDRDGGVSRDVSGNAAKNIIFSGLAKSAGRLSERYEKQADNLVPAVHIQNGATVYFIAQKGVRIDGLPRADHSSISSN